MKRLFIIVISSCCLGLLTGCSTSGCDQGGCGCGSSCGYYDYSSQCGGYSCTDNYQIIEYSNPCPGPYQCSIDMDWI